MSSSIDKRETGSAVMIVGWVMILFAFLVLFFNPAAIKLGETRFQVIAASLAISGLALSWIGAGVRARNR
jgi:hypothetical protein